MTTLKQNYQGQLMSRPYAYDPVTAQEAAKLAPGTVSHADHLFGMERAEPLIMALDAMIVYAKAHKARFFSTLAEDCVLGPEWLEAVNGLRGLLNGNGAVAHFTGRGTDSKDNGACEAMFWAALEIAGYTEADL